MSGIRRESQCILFDWGNTLMRDFPEFSGSMVTWPRVEDLANVKDVFIGLRPRWTLALATNAADSDKADIWEALGRADLHSLLDKVYCFHNIGHRKPSPRFFDYIIADLRMDRSGIIMVGDDFEQDVLGANQSGIRSVWFNECSDEVRIGKMYRTILDFRALPDALATFEID
jgi:putative hydrolase of the HAD superfamily